MRARSSSCARPRDRIIGEDDIHWILEIHLVDEQHAFGGFSEQLLDLA
ncbi:hypothetical protein [Streptomyces chattanoogensis]